MRTSLDTGNLLKQNNWWAERLMWEDERSFLMCTAQRLTAADPSLWALSWHRNTEWHRRSCTQRKRRGRLRQRRLRRIADFFVFPWGLSQKNTSCVWICAWTSRASMSPPSQPHPPISNMHTHSLSQVYNAVFTIQFLCARFFRS